MITKICKICGDEFPIEMMVKSSRSKDGHTSRCKTCHSDKCTKSVKAHPDKRKQSYDKYYSANKEICSQRTRNWQKDNHDKVIEIQRRSRKKNPETSKRYVKKFGLRQTRRGREKYPLKYKARNKVNNAVGKGKMPKANTQMCANCTHNKATNYHHHKGYEEIHWLDVVPVCRTCHRLLDKLLPIVCL